VADPSDQLEDARAFALDYCTRHGDPDAVRHLRLDLPAGRVVFAVPEHRRFGCSISGFLRPGTQETMIARALSRIMRQLARERAIAAAGETGDPAWSLDIHVLELAALWWAGVNPLLLATGGPEDGSGLDAALAGSPITARIEIRAGRVSIPALSIRHDSSADGRLGLYEPEPYGGAPILMVMDHAVPETVAAALTGRALAEIVAHPLIDTLAELRIEIAASRIVSADGNLLVHMADDRTTLSPPPSGIEPDWLRFAWDP